MAFRSLSACLCFALLLLVQPARANDAAAAEALFRSARKAAERGDWVTACDRFEESKRLEPAPGTVLNLARCREKLGQVASAWKSYEEAAQRLSSGDERAVFARKRAQELSARVPRVILIAPDTEKEVLVSVRGVRYSSATFGVPLPLDPGKVTIVVRAAGHEDSTFETRIEEGQTLEHQLTVGIALEPGQDDTQEPEGDQGNSSPSTARRPGAKVMLGIGGAGVAVGIFGAVWAAREQGPFRENCDDLGRCNQTGADAAARGRRAVIVLGAGSAVAAIGLSVGTYLLVKPEPQTAVGFSPVLGGGILQVRRSL